MSFELYTEGRRASKREKSRGMRFRAQRGRISTESRLSMAKVTHHCGEGSMAFELHRPGRIGRPYCLGADAIFLLVWGNNKACPSTPRIEL